MSDSTQKLRLGALIALVVGSMVGGGIFSLPQNIAASAAFGGIFLRDLQAHHPEAPGRHSQIQLKAGLFIRSQRAHAFISL